MLATGYEPEYSEEIDYNSDEKRENSALLSQFFKTFTEDIQAANDLDDMTGLYNRKGFERRVIADLNDVRGGYFFMIDLDNFKKVNDTYGHMAGDIALKKFAEFLKESFGDGNYISRIGGDEFAAFVTKDYSKEQISELTQQFFDDFKSKIHTDPTCVDLSVSMGISHFPSDGESFESLYKNADKALYIVKYDNKDGFKFYENL